MFRGLQFYFSFVILKLRVGETRLRVAFAWDLRHVITNYLLTTRVFLLIDYQGHRYMGAMDFDDPKFCNEIYGVLNSHLGYSLTQIGDLDLPHTL